MRDLGQVSASRTSNANNPGALRRLSLYAKRTIHPPALGKFLRQAHSRDVRHVLLLCLPGAAVAIGLRLWLLFYMPAAFLHDDTAQILVTPERLIGSGVLVIHSKKVFLTPLLYSIAALAHIPLLYFVAIVQHVFGVLLVFLTGLLARVWFSSWRIWIIPLTVLVAINPVLLWYEHTALPESLAVFGVVLVALTGTTFYREPNRYSLALFMLALFFLAGARPEGRLFCLFGLLLVIRRYWGDWLRLRIALPISAAWVSLIFLLTRTGQSGLLLYASMIQWSPDHLVLSPGLAEHLQAIQLEASRQWQSNDAPKLVPLRKQTYSAISAYLKEKGGPRGNSRGEVDAIAKRAGVEIALRNFVRLPSFAVQKFVIAHRELPARDFTNYPLIGQWNSLLGTGLKRSQMLWGVSLDSPEQALAFLKSRYDLAAGNVLTPFLDTFVQTGLFPIAPIELPGSNITKVPLRGLPWLYACAVIGAVCLILRERPTFGFHLIWFLVLCLIFVVLMVTANIRARFRVMFEPFWYIYFFALLDSGIAFLERVLNVEGDPGSDVNLAYRDASQTRP
jgi:hypothetical protein